jgi:Holliday junction resolvase RusA-like endonuclease
MKYVIDIDPCSKPRQTRADKWKKRPCVVKYREFADKLRKLTLESGYKLDNILDICFFLEVPNSTSEKKKKELLGTPHLRRPDIDNLAKAFMDALKEEDSSVHTIIAKKMWSDKSRIELYKRDELYEKI